jgi:SAM-dependent methyltransferase
MTSQDAAPPQEIFLRLSGAGDSPWEIHQPQTAIIKLVEQGFFHGEVLDIGCGIGDNAAYIAKHGNNVKLTAIDMVNSFFFLSKEISFFQVPKAIEVAREKAQKANVDIQFEVVNMLNDLSTTNLKEHSFDIILDSAIFHVFSNDDRLRYIKNLEYLIKPGGLYIQLCFSEKETRQGGPRRITKSDLNELFSPTNGWTIESIEDTIYDSRPDSPLGASAQAYLSLIRRNKTI